MSFDYRTKFASETYQPKEIIAGDYPLITDLGVIASGQNLELGSVLGKVTASGKYVLSTSAASDGSQVPSAILSNDVDASSADQQEIIYLSGKFLAANLKFGTGHTAASVRAALRDANIYI